MSLRLLITLTVVLGFGVVPSFGTVVLTFDDVGGQPMIGEPVPDGYGGLDWDNFGYRVGNAGGYHNGMVSPPCVSFNIGGNPGIVSSQDFDFIGGYLAGAWNNDLQVQVDGYRSGGLIYSRTVTVSYYAPTWVTFNYLTIDELRFSSSGGYDADPVDGGAGTHFVLDDFTLPEPAALALLGVGGMGLVMRRRR